MSEKTWREVWQSQTESKDSLTSLADLLSVDGFNGFGGSVTEDAWRKYVASALSRIDAPPAGSVLEVGCGAGAFLLPLWEQGYRVTGIDYSPTLVELARRAMPTATLTVSDARDLSVADAFDFIVSNGVFIYFPDLEYAADVLLRMVAASRTGLAILDVPDSDRRSEALAARREKLGADTYNKMYDGLSHLYYQRDWFREILSPHFASVDIVDQELDGYFNAPHRFNIFAH